MNYRFLIAFFVMFTITGLFSCKNNRPKNEAVNNELQIRALKDTVGFSFTEHQIRSVIDLAETLEKNVINQNRKKFGNKPWIAGVCPHDDHLLAGRVYVHLFQNLLAKHVIIFGVAHKAADWGAENVFIFDSFDYWQGPEKPVRVSPLRDKIITQLPDSIYVVNNEWQSQEHSVEGIVPVIQHYLPDAEIVSILVPYMSWERIEMLSEQLAAALKAIIQQNGYEPAKDISFICSNDGDHYGDKDWGGRNMAPFGADEAGYLKATGQDSSLIRHNLTGDLTEQKLRDFCQRVWGENDLKDYKIRWCGRFSIPLGLNTVRKLMEKLNHSPLDGYFLRYDTSYNLGVMPLTNIGIGTTAPNHLRHWVGYSAIGYR